MATKLRSGDQLRIKKDGKFCGRVGDLVTLFRDPFLSPTYFHYRVERTQSTHHFIAIEEMEDRLTRGFAEKIVTGPSLGLIAGMVLLGGLIINKRGNS